MTAAAPLAAPRARSSAYRQLVPYILAQWPALSAIALFTILTALSAAIQPWPLKILIDFSLKHDTVPAWLRPAFSMVESFGAWAPVLFAAALSLAVFCINAAIDLGLNYFWAVAGQRMVIQLSTDLFSRLQRLSLQYHRRNSIGDSLSRISTDSWCVYSLSAGLLTPAQRTATIVLVGIVAWQLDSGLAMFALALAPLLAISSWIFGRRVKRRALQGREAQARLVSFVQQTFSSMPVIQAFSTEQRNGETFRSLASDAVQLSQRGALVNSTYGLVNGLILTAGSAGILYMGGQKVLAGTMPIGTLLVFLAYIRNLQSACEGLLNTYSSLKNVEASMDRALHVLDQPLAVSEPSAPRPLPAPRSEGARISIENVSFGYDPERPVLKNVTLDLVPGEALAIVGPTGAGKSTVAALLLRLFDPSEGRITVDGVNIREFDLQSYRGRTAAVLQDPYLFPASIGANIAYGRPGATEEQIVAAAVAANADSFIRKLPDGYNTMVGQRGATLSGGERQRIAIARAFLRDAPLLILDEPTSALDVKTEASLLEALERLMVGRTALIIAHRLSTVRFARRIAVLEEGRVVEQGSFLDLLEQRGAFYRMWALQSGANLRGVA